MLLFRTLHNSTNLFIRAITEDVALIVFASPLFISVKLFLKIKFKTKKN